VTPRIINDNAAAIIKDSTTAAIDSDAIKLSGVEIPGPWTPMVADATGAGLIVIGVIKGRCPHPSVFPTKLVTTQDYLSLSPLAPV
jgi:hypothetical protein